jgi:RNA polymerase sigma factor (sigma-70 family)
MEVESRPYEDPDMAPAPFGTALRQLLRRLGPEPAADRTDGALLTRFVKDADQAAFAALVARHGPMVLGVCRRILHDSHDADDAFQAAFLVLARKAARLNSRWPLGSWLYTVARNLSLKLRARLARRRSHEKKGPPMSMLPERDATAWHEVREVLDTELGHLPEKYRAPLVLCHLQGMTQAEAAQELGWPDGSMAKRLARAQELLRDRLGARGVNLSVGTLATLMAERGSAAVPPALAEGTEQAALLFAAGKATAGLATTEAVTLAAGSVRSFSMTKLTVAALVVGLGTLGGAASGLLGPGGDGPANAAPAEVEARQPAGTVKTEENEADRLRQALDRPINLQDGIPPSTVLQDALDFFSQKYDLTIVTDAKAFESGGIPRVAETAVYLPRLKAVRLKTVLRLLLRQIQLDNGTVGGFRIKGGTLVVEPGPSHDTDEQWLPRSLRRRFLRPIAWDKDIAADTPFSAALELVGKRYGEKFTIDEKTIRSLGLVSPEKHGIKKHKLAGENVTLVEVLDTLMDDLSGKDYHFGYRIKPDHVEVTAAKRDTPASRALLQALGVLRDHRDSQRATAKLSRQLEQPINLPDGFADKTSLKDALEFLSGRHELTFVIDSEAFLAAGIAKVEEFEVDLPPQKDVKLRGVIQKLLDPVQGGDWTASFLIRAEYVEVTPGHKHVKDSKALTREQLDGLWTDLAAQGHQRPRLAAGTFIHLPEQSVPWLREHTRPAPLPDPKKVAEARQWVQDLDSDRFAVRRKAREKLEALGGAAIPAVRERLKAKPALEVRVRLDQLLAKLEPPVTRERLRDERAIAILEEIGTPEAEAVLEKLAKGALGVGPTDAAQAALERLRN